MQSHQGLLAAMIVEPGSVTLAPPTVSPRKLHVRSWGCQMNAYDSFRMADLLVPLGYRLVDTVEDADMVILNTCHIREKAEDKVFSELGRLRQIKEQRASRGEVTILAVAGCVAQAEGVLLGERAPYVDLVVGPQAYHHLPDLVRRVQRSAGKTLVCTEFPVESKFDHLPVSTSTTGPSAFLTIQEGCDKFCTFCVVPYTRGAELSRPLPQILAEAEALVEAGAVEITLLGQNVNAWAGLDRIGKPSSLGRLIQELADIPGLLRIRYTTSHPRDMAPDLIAAHREIPALMPFVHLPVQSGSDRILAAMNRGHTAEFYRDLVGRLRAAQPDLALSSDFIVGFPGETEADFEATLQLVRDVGFASAYSFKYSPRPGTPAASLDGQIDQEEMVRRLATLQSLLDEQRRAFNRQAKGRIISVLLDRKGRLPGQLLGRSPWMQAVHAPAPSRLLGQVVDIQIVSIGPNSLAGQVVAAGATPGQDIMS